MNATPSEPTQGGDNGKPFEPPQLQEHPVAPSSDPSVFAEPWMRPQQIEFAESEGPPTVEPSTEDLAENSVWDEPSTSDELAGNLPSDAVTWIRWYHEQVERTSPEQTIWTTILVATLSGFAAVLGALFSTPQGFLAVIVAAPVVEEILKIGLAIWVVEKRPWLFASRTQILFCGLASGLIFAAIENGLYLNVYISDPTEQIILWRWTVCVALHVFCSLIASIGVAAVWTRFQQEQRMPRLQDGAFFITLAIVLHGVYNCLAVLLELTGAYF